MRPALLACLFGLSAALHAAPPLQQWIDEAIQAGGGVVTVPPGEHVLERGLVIRAAKKLALRGMDKEACVLRLAPGAAPAPLLEIQGPGETLEIANLTFAGGAARAGILLRAPTDAKQPFKDLVVRDCLFESFAADAVRAEGVQGCVVERCSMRDGAGSAVVFGQNTRDSVIRGNQVVRTAVAFDLAGASACLITGNEVREGGIGVRVRQTAPAKPHRIQHNGLLRMRTAALDLDPDPPAPDLRDNTTE